MELVKKITTSSKTAWPQGRNAFPFFPKRDLDELLYLSIPDLHSPIPLRIFAPEFHGSERPFVKPSGRVIKRSFG